MAACLVACSVALAACAPLAAAPAHPVVQTAPANVAGLVAGLRAAGAAVTEDQTLRQPFFRADARILDVDGEHVEVFEYSDASAAAADASRVSADGSRIGTSAPFWIAPPHFYRSGRLLVLYLGEDARTAQRLGALLGPQFAGR